MIWGIGGGWQEKIDDVFYGQSFVTILKLHLYFSMLSKTVENKNFVAIEFVFMRLKKIKLHSFLHPSFFFLVESFFVFFWFCEESVFNFDLL